MGFVLFNRFFQKGGILPLVSNEAFLLSSGPVITNSVEGNGA